MLVEVEEKKFFGLIKKAVSEVFDEKMLDLKLSLIPLANDEDMEEVRNLFHSPDKYKNQEYVKVDI